MVLQIRKVSRESLPKSNTPGRTRQPSDFDDCMREAYEDGEWRGVPYSGVEEDLDKLVSELTRAVVHFDNELVELGFEEGAGKSMKDGIDEETGEPTLFFQIRPKMKTGRRGPRSKDKNGNGTDSEGVLTAAERDEEEIAASVADATASKRKRSKDNADPVTASWG